MFTIDQVIVVLWFVPVVFFIILPLFVACFRVFYAIFDVFKPVAGQVARAVNTISR
jgi:hypothetical protein